MNITVLTPYLILAYGATLLLVIGAFHRRHSFLAFAAFLIFVAALVAAILLLPRTPVRVTPLLYIDALALFYLALFAAGGAVLTVFSRDYLESRPGLERFYVLLIFAVLGMSVLAASVHFASFFLGLQLLSVSLYGLIGFTLRRPASLEASLKYLVLGGVALSFLLLGIALVYTEFGSLDFSALATRVGSGAHLSGLALLGLGFILVAFAFKLALAPAHVWAPDVYQGAPAPITALLATGSKAALFALLLRFVSLLALREQTSLLLLLEILAIATMTVGNLLALLQRNLKRLLAYSSVAHMGYLLIPVLAGGPIGVSALSFYFISYFITTLAAFGIIAALSREGEELESLDDYRGLASRHPWLAAALGLVMLSLAGVPPTVGFIAKFYLFSAAAEARLWLLLIVGIINSGVSVYYYLQVLVVLYRRPADPAPSWPRPRPASALALTALTLALLALGLFPGPVLSGTRQMAELWLSQTGSIPAAVAWSTPWSGARAQAPVSSPDYSGYLPYLWYVSSGGPADEDRKSHATRPTD